MRVSRTKWCLAGFLGLIAPTIASAQKDDYTPIAILEKFRPTQRGVEYDTPTDKAAIDACRVEYVVDPDTKKKIGVALRDGQGQLLRRFLDTNKPADRQMDQWSYYQNGFEVYREIDNNNDRSLDECRWLNAGGTRIAEVKGSKIVAWKRLSVEEASKVLVQGLVTADVALIETVMASPKELEELGAPKGLVDQAAASAAGRRAQVGALMKTLVGWDKLTTWTLFDGKVPHVIPADPALGLKRDVTLYENAVVFASSPDGKNASKMAYLQIPEIVKVGETWKFVDLPHALDPSNAAGAQVAVHEGLRAWLYRQVGNPANSADPALQGALDKLAEHDKQAAPDPETHKREFISFHVERTKLLKQVIEHVKNADEQLAYRKQIVNSLIEAYQTEAYPEALKNIDAYIADGGKIGSYAALRKIQADYSIASNAANPLKAQAAYMERLEGFLKKYAQSEEVPEVLLQLATGNEFNNEEEAARTYYAKLAEEHAATEPGKKAAGALWRLDSVGKPVALQGAGLNGDRIDSSKYQGKTTLLLFWTTSSESGHKDLPELTKLYQKYNAKGFEIIGVCMDNDKATVEQYLKENELPWRQIFEPGGMDGRIGNQFGVISLPMMMLVDPQGKVKNRKVQSIVELEKQLEKPLASRSSGTKVSAK